MCVCNGKDNQLQFAKFDYRRWFVLAAVPAALTLGFAGPAAAGTDSHGSGDQTQKASQVNYTDQTAKSSATSIVVAPATNVSVLSHGDQSIYQNIDSTAKAESTNYNQTWQVIEQSQH